MDGRTESDGRSTAPDASETTRDESADGDDAGDDDGDSPSGALARVKTVGVEAVGAVVDAVLDAF